MKLRRATIADIEGIRSLETEAFDLTWSEEVFRRELLRPDCLFLVGESDQAVVASLSLNWVVDEVQVLSLVLHPDLRGQGLSRQLLGAALALCRKRALQWVHLEVKWHNEPANRLYRHFGFTTVGKRKKYYRDGQDARVMLAGPLKDMDEKLHPYETLAEELVAS